MITPEELTKSINRATRERKRVCKLLSDSTKYLKKLLIDLKKSNKKLEKKCIQEK